ncbi:MAG: response regulator [Pseudolysinimonas sp.]
MAYSVVIADDDADIRALVEISVRKAGLELVAAVADGAAALAAIRRFNPDLAILDVSMPEMTGLQVVREMRSDDSVGDVRVLLLTASVDEGTRSIGVEAGADHFIAKPFSPRELTAWLAVGKEVQ